MKTETGYSAAPAVSVVMSVYNGERYLAEAIESILGQTYRDFEFIIIDDGSTDESLKIVEGYASRDNRIRLVSRPNRGLAAALNDGIEIARAPIIARMDADDVSLPKRFEKQMLYMAQHPE
ncbi:MAG: glycosyltransferase family 2 protein [Candidatus Hydrogenedentes bacterium]|nr:glycosyltransferase family 2 protein [Candidatus Hydrogenedentota bacterium]